MGNRAYKTSRDEIPNYGKGVAVVVANEVDLNVTDGIYVGTTGNLVVTMSDGNDVTFSTIPVGFYPLKIQKVKATTTANAIVALYA